MCSCVFEGGGGGGGRGIQGVVKHHNSVSLPRVKERQKEKRGGGDERISHVHVRGRGRRGRREEKRIKLI